MGPDWKVPLDLPAEWTEAGNLSLSAFGVSTCCTGSKTKSRLRLYCTCYTVVQSTSLSGSAILGEPEILCETQSHTELLRIAPEADFVAVTQAARFDVAKIKGMTRGTYGWTQAGSYV